MKRLFWQAIWFYRRKLMGARRLKGLVLDVGSGNSPYPRADILAERFLSDDTNRVIGRAVVAAAPVVACDAEALPFADNAFDYVVCSHLIEHVDRPDRVLDELSRVGKAGYLECPNEDYDKLDTPPYHRWFARVENGKLVMRQKPDAVFDPGVKELVYETLYPESGFWSAFWHHLDRYFVMLPWEGEIGYRVEYLDLADGTAGSAENSVFDDPEWVRSHGFAEASGGAGETAGGEEGGGAGGTGPCEHRAPPGTYGPPGRVAELTWRLLRRIARGRSPEVDPLSIVVCPADRAALEPASPEALVCSACGEEFPVVEGVPHLYPPGR